MPKPKITNLATKHIRIDGGTQTREEINENAVNDYAEAMRVGKELPPAVVFHDGSNNWLADGFHRYHGANKIGIALLCDIRQGTRRDAILYAAGANDAHGLRRSNETKRRAVMLLLKDEEWRQWSNPVIAQKCGVSDEFVRKIRAEASPTVGDASATRTTKDGRQYPSNIGRSGPTSSEEYIASNPSNSTELKPADDDFEDDPFADEVEGEVIAHGDLPAGDQLDPFGENGPSIDGEGTASDVEAGAPESETSDVSESEADSSGVTPPEPEPTTEEKIRTSPLGQALAMHGHQGYKFVESALLQEDLWKKISALHAVAGRLRHATHATADVWAPGARFAHWEKWEG